MPENDEIPVFQVILTASASVTQADGATAADDQTTQEG
jgi:hypothetical protein